MGTEVQQTESRPDQVDGDLECPQCRYNLKGLNGTIVSCPECGLQIDVTRLRLSRSLGPWYRSPAYNALKWPVAWAILGGTICAPLSVILASRFGNGVYLWVAGSPGVFFLLVWLASLVYIWQRHDGFWGLWRALALHGALLGYVVGTFGGLGGLLYIWTDTSLSGGGVVGLSAGVLAGTLGLFWSCRCAERAIAESCMRRHLLRKTRESRIDLSGYTKLR